MSTTGFLMKDKDDPPGVCVLQHIDYKTFLKDYSSILHPSESYFVKTDKRYKMINRVLRLINVKGKMGYIRCNFFEHLELAVPRHQYTTAYFNGNGKNSELVP